MKASPKKSIRILRRVLFGFGFLTIGAAIAFPITSHFVKENTENKMISVWEIFTTSTYYAEKSPTWTPQNVEDLQKTYSPNSFVYKNSAEYNVWVQTFASLVVKP